MLRDRFGLADASPFSYVAATSPYLNVYCEPPEYLDATDRAAFEPIAFFGSLPSSEEIDRRRRARTAAPWGDRGRPRIFVSLGTVVRRYYEREVVAALSAVAEGASRVLETQTLLVVGGTPLSDDARTALARPRVTVEVETDQWAALEGADLFVTHQGLNSTHEAVWHGVPMLSYPFFWDQPALARRCEEFGLATRLVPTVRGALDAATVELAVCDALARRDAIRERLAVARAWEEDVMARRDSVVTRLLDLA